MQKPRITRPTLPPGYVDNPIGEVEWEYVVQRLKQSKNYWLATVRPNNRPHVVPRWGVWVENRFYYDGSPETRHARNLQTNAAAVLHLEEGDQAVILEGFASAHEKPEPDLAQKISDAFKAKYAIFGYAPEPTQWDTGGLFMFTPKTVLAWTVFFENPTKFVFD